MVLNNDAKAALSHRSLLPLFVRVFRCSVHGNSLCQGEAFSEVSFPLEASLRGFVLHFSLFSLPTVEDVEAKVWSGKGWRIVWLPERGPAGHFSDPLSNVLCSKKSLRTPGHPCQGTSLACCGSSEYFLAHRLNILSIWYLEAMLSWEFLHMPSLFEQHNSFSWFIFN